MSSSSNARRRRVLRTRAPDHGPAADVGRDEEPEEVEERAGPPPAARPPAVRRTPSSNAALIPRSEAEGRTPPDGTAYLQPYWRAADAVVRPKVVLTDTRTGSVVRFEFRAPQAVVGSEDGVHLTLPGLAPRQAVLQAVSGGVLCLSAVHRGLAKNGEETNGVLLRGRGSVRLGPYDLALRRSAPGPSGASKPRLRQFLPPADADPDAEPGPDPDGAALGLAPADGPNAPVWITAARPALLVGSGRRAAVELAGGHAAHALLVRAADGAWVVDLRSEGGTRVNGRPVRRRRLGPGDRVEFGDEAFVVVPPAAARTPAPVRTAEAPPAEPAFAGAGRSGMEQLRAMLRVEFDRQEDRLGAMLDGLRAELEALGRLDREVAELRLALQSDPVRDPRAVPAPPGPAEDVPVAPPEAVAPPTPAAAPARPRRVTNDGLAEHAALADRLAGLERDRGRRWSALLNKLSPG